MSARDPLSSINDFIPPAWAAVFNPYWESCHARCRETAIQLGAIAGQERIVERFDEEGFALLTSYCYPAASLEQLVVITDFCGYLFFVDDIADTDVEIGRHADRLSPILDMHVAALLHGEPGPSHEPLAELLVDIRRRLLEFMSPRWHERFAGEVREYLIQGTLAGAHHWTRSTTPRLEDYIAQRRFDSALYPAQSLIEVAESAEMPEALERSPGVRRMRELCNGVVSLTNDLFSYPKEVLRSRNPNNVLHVLMTHEGLGLEEAVDRTVELLRGMVEEFHGREQALHDRVGPSDVLSSYVRGLRSWMRGNIDWSLRSGRYRSLHSVFPELRLVTEMGHTVPESRLGGWR